MPIDFTYQFPSSRKTNVNHNYNFFKTKMQLKILSFLFTPKQKLNESTKENDQFPNNPISLIYIHVVHNRDLSWY